MAESSSDFRTSTFSKTLAGQEEIHSRSLGLGVLARRLLVLVDGKRTGAELVPFVAGQDIGELLQELLGHGLVSMVASSSPPATPAPPSPASSNEKPSTDWIGALPPAETRSAKELEMARNFMTNTVNNIFGHHNRISLIEAIHGCQSSTDLRKVYEAWASAMESNSAGHKRLPEFREKLFAVL